jgi:hypothetical protein
MAFGRAFHLCLILPRECSSKPSPERIRQEIDEIRLTKKRSFDIIWEQARKFWLNKIGEVR